MLSLKKMVEEVIAKLVNDLFLEKEILEEANPIFKGEILDLDESYREISRYVFPYDKLRFINESLANV